MGAATLTRFFALHVVILPAALAVLIMLHVGLVYRLGIADPLPRRKGGSAPPDAFRTRSSCAKKRWPGF